MSVRRGSVYYAREWFDVGMMYFHSETWWEQACTMMEKAKDTPFENEVSNAIKAVFEGSVLFKRYTMFFHPRGIREKYSNYEQVCLIRVKLMFSSIIIHGTLDRTMVDLKYLH
jgi:hypothetical protein